MRIFTMALLSMAFIVVASENLHAAVPAPWSIGYRVELLTANGDPANDMMGSGAFLRYAINARDQAEIAFEYVEYDFESPQRALGYARTSGADVEGRTRLNLMSAKLERAWRPAQVLRPFAFLGLSLGYAKLDDVVGEADGQSFDIDAEGGVESVPAGGVGLRCQQARWMVEIGVKIERHLADWTLEDRRTGRVVEVGDYTAWGAWLGAAVRF